MSVKCCGELLLLIVFMSSQHFLEKDKTIFSFSIGTKYWPFIHFHSCSHQVNCTHWTKWYFTDFPYLLLANQWRPKIWEDYGDDTSTYFLKSTFPFWKNVHNWLCHLFPSWTLPCIALCKRARLKLEDAKIGPDLPIILTDTRGIANTSQHLKYEFMALEMSMRPSKMGA